MKKPKSAIYERVFEFGSDGSRIEPGTADCVSDTQTPPWICPPLGTSLFILMIINPLNVTISE